jgi:hypothetical protein
MPCFPVLQPPQGGFLMCYVVSLLYPAWRDEEGRTHMPSNPVHDAPARPASAEASAGRSGRLSSVVPTEESWTKDG